jgi:stalled ribosome alternative rescue factor ArfA
MKRIRVRRWLPTHLTAERVMKPKKGRGAFKRKPRNQKPGLL